MFLPASTSCRKRPCGQSATAQAFVSGRLLLYDSMTEHCLGLCRKSFSADTPRQMGFSPNKAITPRIEEDEASAPSDEAQKNGSANPPPGGGNSSNGSEVAERSKSMLSEEILNPYGDENGEATEHAASM